MPRYRVHIEYPEDPHAIKPQGDPEKIAELKHLASLPRRHPEVLAYLQKHRILVWGENDWNSPWFHGNIQTADGMLLYFWNKEDFFEKFKTELAKDFYQRAQDNRMR